MILVILTTAVLLRKNLEKSTWRLNSSEFTHFCIYDLKKYLQFHSIFTLCQNPEHFVHETSLEEHVKPPCRYCHDSIMNNVEKLQKSFVIW